jgi:hypothetical protein
MNYTNMMVSTASAGSAIVGEAFSGNSKSFSDSDGTACTTETDVNVTFGTTELTCDYYTTSWGFSSNKSDEAYIVPSFPFCLVTNVT